MIFIDTEHNDLQSGWAYYKYTTGEHNLWLGIQSIMMERQTDMKINVCG